MTIRSILVVGGAFVLVSLVIVKTQEYFSSREAGIANSPSAHPGLRLQQKSNDKSSTSNNIDLRNTKLLPARSQLEGQASLTAPTPEELSTNDRSPLANLLGALNTQPEREPNIVLDILKTYRRLFGSYPAGEGNRQFVNALLGANKEKLPLIPSDHPRINSQGEIVDAWGTPFFFHQNSRSSIEVRSAGPDRSFYTTDDIVAGKSPMTLGESFISNENPDE